MIDTHAHLDFKDFNEDRKEVIARFFLQKGKAIINVGVDLERSRKSIEIAKKHEGIFASVGLHPEYFSKAKLSDILKLSFRIDELRKLAKHKKVVAIGEIGLDYFHMARNFYRESSHPSAPLGHLPSGRGGGLEKHKDRQKKGFLAQIGLAQELGLPVIVHCREAWEGL